MFSMTSFFAPTPTLVRQPLPPQPSRPTTPTPAPSRKRRSSILIKGTHAVGTRSHSRMEASLPPPVPSLPPLPSISQSQAHPTRSNQHTSNIGGPSSPPYGASSSTAPMPSSTRTPQYQPPTSYPNTQNLPHLQPTTSRGSPPTSGSSKLKSVLSGGRSKHGQSPSGEFGEGWGDGAVSDVTSTNFQKSRRPSDTQASSQAQSLSAASRRNPSQQFPSPAPIPSSTASSRARSRSEAAALGLSGGEGSSKPSSRSRLVSNIHSIATNIRKHGAQFSTSAVSSFTSPAQQKPPTSIVSPKPPILKLSTPMQNEPLPTALVPAGPTSLQRSATPPGRVSPPGGYTTPTRSTVRIPKNVTAIAAQVVSNTVGQGRTSVMSSTPSISAALEFMMDDKTSKRRSTASSVFASISNSNSPKSRRKSTPAEERTMKRKSNMADGHGIDKAVKRRSGVFVFSDERSAKRKSGAGQIDGEKAAKRRSGTSAGILQPPGGIVVVEADEMNTADFTAASTQGGQQQAPPTAGAAVRFAKTTKRKSAGEALKPSVSYSTPPAERQQNSDGMFRVKTGSATIDPVQAAYQYVNAEPDGQPSFFVARSHGLHPSHAGSAPKTSMESTSSISHSSGRGLPVTPALTAAPISSSPSGDASGVMAPLVPPRRSSERKRGAAVVVEYASGGESSGAESAGEAARRRAGGGALKNNIKGRLSAWTAVHSSHKHGAAGQRGKPTISFSSPQSSNSTMSPPAMTIGSPSASSSSGVLSPSSPETNMSSLGATLRAKSNSSNTSIGSSSQPHYHGGNDSLSHSHHPQLSPTSYRTPNPTAIGYGLGGSIGAVAGGGMGAAFNLGKRGWDRVERLWGHRHTQANGSGSWSGMSGDEFGSMGGGMGGFMSESATKQRRDIYLGTMIRAPIRQSGMVFGRALEECVKETRVGVGPGFPERPLDDTALWVPALVTRCIEHLHRYAMEEEGLFRIPGRSSHMNTLKQEFDTGADYNLQEATPGDLDPHAVSSIFKSYIRQLPEPILTRALSSQFDGVMSTETGVPNNPGSSFGMSSFGGAPGQGPIGLSGGTSSSMRLPKEQTMLDLKSLVGRLPRCNFDLLQQLCALLRRTAQNSKATKMPLSNLLLLFCPSLQLSPGLLRLLVERQDYLFGDGSMGDVRLVDVEEDDDDDDEVVLKPSAPVSAEPHVRMGLPSRPNIGLEGMARRRDRSATTVDTQQRNRAISVYALESYSVDGLTSVDSVQLPNRPPSPHNPSPVPSSVPSSATSARFRTAHRKPSLNLLFSAGKPAPPVISAPIPIASSRPSTPAPLIQLDFPDASTSDLGHSLKAVDDKFSPPSPVYLDASPTLGHQSSFEGYRTASEFSRGPSREPSTSRRPSSPEGPSAKQPASELSPPPQISPLNSPTHIISGEDWAASVLKLTSRDGRSP